MKDAMNIAKRIEISNEMDFSRATLEATKLAGRIGFRRSDQYQISIAVSELVTNMYRYAKGGCIIIRSIERRRKKGIEVIAEDKGPGIEDIEMAMQDGFSTSKSLGLGLPGVKRLMDEFNIKTELGKGTRIVVTKWIRRDV
nr:ATP-binding protein [Desulfobacterales bacterium]